MPAGIFTVILRCFGDLAGAVARLARLGDGPAGAAALRARTGDGEEALLEPHLPLPAALTADDGRGSGRGARSGTGFAGFLAGNLDGGFRAPRRFLEGDFEVVAQIGAALRPAAPPRAAEQIAEAEDVTEAAEDVPEVGEDCRIDAGAADVAHRGMAEPVVRRALVGVGEDRVRLGALLELLFGRLVAGIAVRVVLERQLAVGALHLDLGDGARDAEDLVVVAFAHALATLTMAGRSRRSPIM